MSGTDATGLFLSLPIWFVGGLVLGFAYFRALRKTADLVTVGGSPLLGLTLSLGRLAVLGAVFFIAVLSGGLSLLAALAGVLSAKALMLRQSWRDNA